jgi:hypothetical protein
MNTDKIWDQQLNRHIHQVANDERFPVSNMNKDSVHDAELMKTVQRSPKPEDSGKFPKEELDPRD